MSDYLRPPGSAPNLLPDHLQKQSLFDKPGRSFETEGLNQMQQVIASTRREGRPADEPGETYVFLENVMPQSIHIDSEGLIVPGQLTTDPKGPFERVKLSQVEDSFVLQGLIEPDARDKRRLRVLTKDEHRAAFEVYTKETRPERMARLAQASEYEREDSDYDIKKTHLKVQRQSA